MQPRSGLQDCRFKPLRHSRLVRLLRLILRESGASVSRKGLEVPAWRQADGTRGRLDVAMQQSHLPPSATVSASSSTSPSDIL